MYLPLPPSACTKPEVESGSTRDFDTSERRSPRNGPVDNLMETFNCFGEEHPHRISDGFLSQALEPDTAYCILSVQFRTASE